MSTAFIIWIIGYLYACGKHQTAKELIKESGIESTDDGWLEYVVLLFAWPHYLGHR